MKLTEEQKEKAKSLLKQIPKCPYCSCTEHGIDDNIVNLLGLRDDSIKADANDVTPFPMYMIVCQNCGHVSLFSVRALG